MKNSTIRLIFILALVLASGIIVTQVYWVRSAYHLTEQEFNLNVNISLREVAEKLWQEKGIEPQVSHAVERVSPECYMVHVGIPMDPVLLEKDLRNAFIQNKVVTSFGFAVYGSRNGNIQYKKYARVGGSIPQVNPELSFPVNSARDLAFAVYFPHRKAFYGIQLQIWTITSVILL